MDEKEIEQTILDNIDFVPAGEPATVRINYKKAAHAIAEKLAEGVVYKVKASISHYNSGTDALTVVTTVYGDFIDITGHKGKDGQLVTVTVTREE